MLFLLLQMVDVSFSNCYMSYILNGPYIYPPDNKEVMDTGNGVNTGWHIIPNFLWRHFVTPKQWADLMIHYEAYHVKGYTITLYNMIPMTQQLAIQGTSVFTAFNNTIYAIAYQDTLYETSWETWLNTAVTPNQPNLAWKEGLIYNLDSDQKRRLQWPVYIWKAPQWRVSTTTTFAYTDKNGQGEGVFPFVGKPDGIFWDPLNRPEHIMELRPGKNAIKFTWECHPCDADKWFNIDQVAAWAPWTVDGPFICGGRPQTRKLTAEMDPDLASTEFQSSPHTSDYTVPNMANLPIVPMGWWWKEMRQTIIDTNHFDWHKPDKYWSGTEYEMYKYGPTQCFIKMIPLFDDNGTHISASAQIAARVEIHLSCKKRRSAIFAPTWGPFGWRQLYSARQRNRIYQPDYIRYRTGGARRSWQNVNTVATNGPHAPFWREDPYVTTDNVNTHYPQLPGYSFGTEALQGKEPLQITVEPSTSSRTFKLPCIKPRQKSTPRDAVEQKDVDVKMMEDITQM
ncbi:capsid protein [Barn owl parvovirus]|uniref:Capsid protein n=2 Tax=Chaphamaparvovirus TaxID=2733231 RepID=A0A7T1NDR1_9VIRU|nr:capsid protein [Chaphamaparvovirus gyb-MR2/2015/HUN]QPN96886.1 capsid protein [Chaphamaparvovirus gyb-MR2/2015/HUN]